MTKQLQRGMGLALAFALVLVGVQPLLALETGAKVPEIGQKDLSGKSVTVGALAGKVVVVDFWASWCAPCKQELPLLDKLYKKYQAQGLVVIGVSVDKDVANVRKFLGAMPLSFPIVHDADHGIASRYAPPKMPSSYIVDRKGIVRFVQQGFHADDAGEIEAQIKSLLAKK
jgi:cytochrome c biogenesis protein CcmG, thiol:disulfide interchange protein DsbE